MSVNESPREEKPARNSPKRATTGLTFKWAAIIVGGFTLLAYLTHVALAQVDPQSDAIKYLIENCVQIYQTGFAVFLGLIAGKATP